MMREDLHRVASTISAWSEGHAKIRGCFWYGGYARGTCDDRSDLDVAIVVEPDARPSALREELTALFLAHGETVRWSSILDGERRIVFWLGAEIVKLDLRYAFVADDLAWIADATDVPGPRLVPAWPPRDPSLEEMVRRSRVEADVLDVARRSKAAEAEIDKFIVAFEACSMLHARSDGYGFYFQYNLALGRQIRLVQLVRAGARYLHLPRNILSGQMTLAEQLRTRELAGSLYLPEATRQKERLAAEFLRAAAEARDVLGVVRDIDGLARLLEDIRGRDFFFNLRDVAKFSGGRIVARRWFRSSALARWTGTPELDRWLRANGVTDIVDLRDTAQAAKMPYAAEDLRGRRYHHLPIDGPGSDEPNDGYFEAVRANARQIRGFVDVLATADGAVLVHCHIGRDRTGWMCALLLAALGLPATAIEEDYLASLMAASSNFVREFLAGLDARGGAIRFLESVGVSDASIAAVAGRLLNAPPR